MQVNRFFKVFNSLIVSFQPVENIIERLNFLEKEGFNIYEVTLYYCMNDKLTTNYAVPLLRAWSETGFEVKEPFFWPLLANYGSENVQGLLGVFIYFLLIKKKFSIY